MVTLKGGRDALGLCFARIKDKKRRDILLNCTGHVLVTMAGQCFGERVLAGASKILCGLILFLLIAELPEMSWVVKK